VFFPYPSTWNEFATSVWMTCSIYDHGAIYTLLRKCHNVSKYWLWHSLLIICLQHLSMEVTKHESRRPQPILCCSQFSCQVIFHVSVGSGPLAFYSTSEELSMSSASLAFSPIWFLSPFLACVVTEWFEFRSRRAAPLWFPLVCLDVVSEVLCFLTCWPHCDPAVSMVTAPAVRGCGSTGLCGCIPALTSLHV